MNIHLSICCSVFSLQLAATFQIQWEFEETENGVEVYTGFKTGSEYKAFKAVTLIEAAPREVLRVLQEVAGYSDWFAYTEKAQLLDATPHAKIVYMETRFPWPFANEDMIYKMTVTTFDDSTVRLNLEGIPNYLSPVDGVHRMKSANGHIDVRPVGNKTEVTYFMHSELGGRVPLWMANQNIYELPLRTLSGLKKQLEE